jgi:hypothetical protein
MPRVSNLTLGLFAVNALSQNFRLLVGILLVPAFAHFLGLAY